MENILEKEAVQRVKKILNEFDKDLKVEILDNTARTANDAASSLNCEVGAIVKSLLLRTDKDFILCLVSGDKRCSLNKVKKIIDNKDVSMANADQVKKQTGFSIGGVSPIGHIEKINTLVDKSLSRFENIYAAAGHHSVIFGIHFDQLIILTKGEVSKITED